jgi:Zn-dependent protease with chaperone function/predicted Zn-dependent protease
MRTDWQGFYLDGRTAARHRATIRLMQSGLEITTESGTTLWWRYEEIRQTQGFYAGEQVRLERGGETPEVLLVSDTTFLTDLRQVAPKLTTYFHDPARRRMRAKLTLLAALGAIGITTALYLWGIPALAALVASRVPVSWEERLGQAVVEHLAPPEKRCADPERARVINDIVTALTAPLPRPSYTFRVMVVDDPTVNAFAAPGGYVVIFRGLLERTRSAEELAGVLAHELQHVFQRHATRALLQHASTGLLIAALAGDASGAMTYGLESARALGTLRYSRQNEEEADAEGMRMLLAAGIDPAGMIAFFKVLQKEGGEAPGLLAYLSTHPNPGDRIESLKSLASQSQRTPVKLLPDYDWGDITKICHAAGSRSREEKRARPATTPPPPSQGVGRVYFVPLGAFSSPSVEELVTYYHQKLGLKIETLPALSVERAVVNFERQQLIAEELVALIKRKYPELAGDPGAILIGITPYDMYIRRSTWRFAFAFRDEGRFAVVSSTRMDPVNLREPPDPALLHTRLRKMVSKNIGIMHYRLPQTTDRNSVLYGPILSLDDLDSIGEEF